jgi:hypothetical protein
MLEETPMAKWFASDACPPLDEGLANIVDAASDSIVVLSAICMHDVGFAMYQ